MKYKDFTGIRYGRLLAIARHHYDAAQQQSYWLMQCDCGRTAVVSVSCLTSGSTRSCGCLHRDTARQMQRKNFLKHGKYGTPVFTIWMNMKTRCQKPSDNAYLNYGGRGIVVCDRWQTFENFYADMGDPPPLKTLDRIDNNGPYSPENCRWATVQEQARNRRSTVLIEIGDRVLCLKDWAEIFQISYKTVHRRYHSLGWDIIQALTEPVKYSNRKIWLPKRVLICSESECQGIVVAAGSVADVKVGDKVIYARHVGTEYKIDDVEHLLVHEDDLLAVVEDE